MTVEVLKWVGIALAAGFIGYFGRYFAMLIIERMRANKLRSTPPTEAVPEASASQEPNPEVARLEIEKKKAKIEKKKAKARAKKAKKKGKK